MHYFNREDIGAEVVQLSIKNDGPTPWVLSQDCIDLPLVDSKVVSQKLQAGIGKSVAMVLIPFVGLPLSIIHGISSHDANERIKEDIEKNYAIRFSSRSSPTKRYTHLCEKRCIWCRQGPQFW